MNCEMVCHLIDDYLENRLSRRERQRLEMHLTSCSNCTDELRLRPAFEHQMWRALTASVQNVHLSAGASARMVQVAQDSMRRGVWSKRAALTLQLVTGAMTAALVIVGLLVLLGQVPTAVDLPVLPRQFTSRPALSVTPDNIVVEPQTLHPGEPFTTTIFLHSDLAQPVDAVRFKLSISGPTGDYDFALALHGPFPAQGVSVLRVTPELLVAPCRDLYQISPADIVRVPGTYVFRATLLSPIDMPEQ